MQPVSAPDGVRLQTAGAPMLDHGRRSMRRVSASRQPTGGHLSSAERRDKQTVWVGFPGGPAILGPDETKHGVRTKRSSSVDARKHRSSCRISYLRSHIVLCAL